MIIDIVNGPNLNLLSKREPEIYGSMSFESYLEVLKSTYPSLTIRYFQSNHEGELIDYLHAIGFEKTHIIINAGAYSHTSIAIADALRSITAPAIEVHLSNIYRRESFRHHSYIAQAVQGTICGLGLKGYELAIESFLSSTT